MHYSSFYFRIWIGLKGESYKTFHIIMPTKFVFVTFWDLVGVEAWQTSPPPSTLGVPLHCNVLILTVWYFQEEKVKSWNASILLHINAESHLR